MRHPHHVTSRNPKAFSNQSGQALIAALGLFAVTAIVFFFVFNSNRAVNEKLNLVNAADAAAYSGAQIAARQLNFIAYTNRVMIANEVAVGHMVSFQAELEVMSDAMRDIDGIAGEAVEAVLNSALSFIGQDLGTVADAIQRNSMNWSGAYILGVSANNAVYLQMQQEERDALGGTVMTEIMDRIVEQYANNEDARLSVNSDAARTYLQDNGYQNVAAMMTNNANSISSLVAFADPSQSGELLAMIQQSADALSDPARDWITDRNLDEYRVGGLFGFLGFHSTRSGSTQLRDDGNGGHTWAADAEELKLYTKWGSLLGIPLGIEFEGEASGIEADSIARQASTGVLLNGSQIARSRLCSDVNCASISSTDGYQSVKNQAIINQALIDPATNQPNAFVTAVVLQEGSCNDALGRDKAQGPRRFGENVRSDWNDDLGRFGSACDNEREVVAVSRARLVYERPQAFTQSAADDELPNLYNPFWQAKLDYVDTR